MKNLLRLKRKLWILLLLPVFMGFTSDDKPAYRFYTADGKPIGYQQMITLISTADVVFFGELHNNPICHWMELEMAMDLWKQDSTAWFFGAEMFETDQQLILDEYLTGQIRDRDFESGTKLWDNYKTDYKPLVSFAAAKKTPFIATNVPRRYAALVNQKGFESLENLSASARAYLPPLPVPYDPELPGYKAMAQMGSGAMHANNNLPKAQAIKDATMAWFIAKNLTQGKKMLHFNGSYHSDGREGIVWYLNQYKPGLKIVTITTIEQESLNALDSAAFNKADYIMTVQENITKSY
ncbi:MAG TPA: ChaN family lipoprotein [Bacteroidales bacterium]|nr:ChaN family lipoprotein [Bacteroidales bacterium]HRZ48021.1 ChaN family lipoprotein [Bacteroidales bacterium]